MISTWFAAANWTCMYDRCDCWRRFKCHHVTTTCTFHGSGCLCGNIRHNCTRIRMWGQWFSYSSVSNVSQLLSFKSFAGGESLIFITAEIFPESWATTVNFCIRGHYYQTDGTAAYRQWLEQAIGNSLVARLKLCGKKRRGNKGFRNGKEKIVYPNISRMHFVGLTLLRLALFFVCVPSYFILSGLFIIDPIWNCLSSLSARLFWDRTDLLIVCVCGGIALCACV